MAEPIHPTATHHLTPFVTAPGETDVLFVAMASEYAHMFAIIRKILLRMKS